MVALYQHIVKYVDFTSEDFLTLLPFLDLISVPKKTKFLEYGQPSDYLYFVLEGLMYIQYEGAMGDNGCITTFVSENEWVNSTFYDFEPTMSLHDFVTIEKTTMVTINKADLQKVLEIFPQLHFYFGKIQDYRIYKLDVAKISHSINKSTSRFEMFRNGYLNLIPRIPYQLIAAYLNMKPETLSRSKKKKD